MSAKTINSDLVKFVVDLGTGILKIINAIGGLTTPLIVIGEILAAYKLPALVGIMQGIIASVKGIADASLIAGYKIAGVTVSIEALTAATTLGLTLALAGIVYLFDQMANREQKLAEQTDKLKSEYESLKTEITSLNDELKTTNESIDTLLAKDSLTLVEENELQKLKDTNEELKTRIELKERELELKGQETNKSIETQYKEDFLTPYEQPDYEFAYAHPKESGGEEAFYQKQVEYYKELTELGEQRTKFQDEEFTALKKYLNDTALEYSKLAEDYVVYDDASQATRDHWLEMARIGNDALNTQTQAFEKLNQLIDSDKYKGVAENLLKVAKAGNLDAKTVTSYFAFTQAFKDLGFTVDDIIVKFNAMAAAEVESTDAIDETLMSSEELANKGKELESANKDLTSSISDLVSIQKAQSEGTVLSSMQIVDMLMKYPELVTSIKDVKDGYILETDAVQDLINLKIKLLKINADETVENKKNAYLAAGGYQEAVDNYANLIKQGVQVDYTKFMGENNGYVAGNQFAEYIAALYNDAGIDKITADMISKGIQEGFTPSKSTEDAAAKVFKVLKQQYDRQEINTKEYYDKLKAYNDQYYKNDADHIDDYEANITELFNLKSQIHDETIQDMEHEIAMLENVTGTEEQQISVYERMISEVQTEIKRLQDLGLDATNDLIQEQEKLYADFGQKIIDIEKSQITEAQNNINGLLDLTLQMLRKKYDLQKEGIQGQIDDLDEAYDTEKSNLDNINDLQEKAFESRRKALEDEKDRKDEMFEQEKENLKNLRDAQKELSDDEKQELEDKLKAYQNLINKQLELLRIKEEEHDYNRDLQSKNKDISQIQNELTDLSGDTSAEANKRRLELEEELQTKLDELAEFQHDKEVSRQEQSLQDELSRYEELTQANTDAIDREQKAQEDSYQAQLDRLEKEQEAYNKNHESQLKNIDAEEERWKLVHENLLKDAEIRYEFSKGVLDKQIQDIEVYLSNEANIRNEAMALMESKTDAFYKDLINYNTLYGNGVTNDVKNKWDLAYGSLQKFNVGQQGVLSTLNQMTGKMTELTTKAYELSNALIQGQNNAQTVTTSQDLASIIQQRLAEAKVKIPVPGTYDGYAEGGVNSYTGLAQMHGTPTSAETIFNSIDSKKLYDLIHDNTVGNLRNMILKPVMNNMSIPQTQPIVFNFEAVIQGNADESVISQMESMQKEWSDKIFEKINKHLGMGKKPRLGSI